MDTAVIKPNPQAANWITATERDGYVSVSRVNADGEVLQSFCLYPEEVPALMALLGKREAA